ncbi:Mrp/NBP35 family ATP-binding protein [Candidatus Bathyarchaeota archaeon A05DMB-2]|jgi:ATP-binding protein involved in chromosome partitioning|nr:Mrp/NBP35 family ATP-binding protein [Candidatus Bathyarchaeota archaeon A05DMB-2]
MVDPRTTIINERLKRISRIIAVSSGKGGVGKSIVATTLALTLSRSGYKVGLFDLDFTSPSTHLILGAKDTQPKEDKGIIPPVVHGLAYMSLIYYSHDQAAPLRGIDTSNALIELLAVTQWGELDFLIIDMPPGIGDAVLDLIRLVKRIDFLIVTTPSLLAFETVRKQVALLQSVKVPIIGIVENMKMTNAANVRAETGKLGLKFLAEIPYDAKIEEAIGDETKLLGTVLAKKIRQLIASNAL